MDDGKSIKKIIRYFGFFSIFTLILILFYTLVNLIVYIYESRGLGGINLLDMSTITGHLVIVFLCLGCLYFSSKITLKIR